MDGRGGWLDLAAWSAADKHWYADLVAHCQGSWCAPEEADTVLEALNQRPWQECLHMAGGQLDGRYEDIREDRWAADSKGRWSAQISGKKVFLHHAIAQLQSDGMRHKGDVGSHLCGFCDCVRLEHIKFQPRAEDIRDEWHHSRGMRGEIRSDSRTLAGKRALVMSPASRCVSTVDRERIRSRIERD